MEASGDIYRLAERKRAEADRARYELNVALKELYELQSQAMQLEREGQIIDEQLQRGREREGTGGAGPLGSTSPTAGAGSPKPGGPRGAAASGFGSSTGLGAAAAPAGALDDAAGSGAPTRGKLLHAVYKTDRIASKVAVLEGISASIGEEEYKGRILEHMRGRLAEGIIAARKVARDLGLSLDGERAKAGDLARREVEVARNLGAAQARQEALKRDQARQLGSMRQNLADHKDALARTRDSNAFLEQQINMASAALTARKTQRDRAATPQAGVGGGAADFAGGGGRRGGMGSRGGGGGAPGGAGLPAVLTARTIKQRVTAALAGDSPEEAEEGALLEALRSMGLSTAAFMQHAAGGGGVGASGGGLGGGPPSPTMHAGMGLAPHALGASLGSGGLPSSPSLSPRQGLGSTGRHPVAAAQQAAAAIDPDFLVAECWAQDEVRSALLQKIGAEEARMTAMTRQLQALRSIAGSGAGLGSGEGALGDTSALAHARGGESGETGFALPPLPGADGSDGEGGRGLSTR